MGGLMYQTPIHSPFRTKEKSRTNLHIEQTNNEQTSKNKTPPQHHKPTTGQERNNQIIIKQD
jgi:hypothetical protein